MMEYKCEWASVYGEGISTGEGIDSHFEAKPFLIAKVIENVVKDGWRFHSAVSHSMSYRKERTNILLIFEREKK